MLKKNVKWQLLKLLIQDIKKTSTQTIFRKKLVVILKGGSINQLAGEIT